MPLGTGLSHLPPSTSMRFLLLTLLCILTAQSAHADYSTQFIRYKAEPDLSRIVISWEEVRGHRGVDHIHANPEAFATQGDYVTGGQSGGSKVITKTEQMDGHEVKTVITIRYPRGHGFGGACSWNDIQIFFNGELQLDSPMGYDHGHSITVSKVTIHVQDESIKAISRDFITGEHYHFIKHADGEVLRLPEEIQEK